MLNFVEVVLGMLEVSGKHYKIPIKTYENLLHKLQYIEANYRCKF